MEHSHHHHDHHHHHGSGNMAVAFFLNLAFAIIEFIGGALTNSIAITSDALHDLGDSVSIGISWYFERVSKKKRDNSFTYGYKRFSLLGALVNALVLIIGSVIVLYEAIPRLFHQEEVGAGGMFWFAVLGIAVNGLAVFRLRHDSAINRRMVMLHLMEDVLGWIAVLIASVFIYFWNITILDPILSIAITCWVLYNVTRNLIEIGRILLQGVPKTIDLPAIEQHILQLEGVVDVHDVHVWSMDSDYTVLSLHIVVKKGDNEASIKRNVHQLLHQSGINHSTIETEMEGDECISCNCDSKPPH
ncbi:MAG: cation diffusion facilitator family transporter [Marinifilaceae bacterium]